MALKTMYQLSCSGESGGGWAFMSLSKRVFMTAAEALAYGPEFIKKCEDPTQLNNLIPGTGTVSVRELELDTDPAVVRSE